MAKALKTPDKEFKEIRDLMSEHQHSRKKATDNLMKALGRVLRLYRLAERKPALRVEIARRIRKALQASHPSASPFSPLLVHCFPNRSVSDRDRDVCFLFFAYYKKWNSREILKEFGEFNPTPTFNGVVKLGRDLKQVKDWPAFNWE